MGFVTLDNQFKKLDDGKTLISEDVVDAVFSSFWLKTDGSLYYKSHIDEHLVVKDDAIESLYHDDTTDLLKTDGSVWKLNGNPLNGYNLLPFYREWSHLY